MSLLQTKIYTLQQHAKQLYKTTLKY